MAIADLEDSGNCEEGEETCKFVGSEYKFLGLNIIQWSSRLFHRLQWASGLHFSFSWQGGGEEEG